MLAAAGTTNRSMPANLARQNVATTAAEREFWRPATGAVWAAAEATMA